MPYRRILSLGDGMRLQLWDVSINISFTFVLLLSAGLAADDSRILMVLIYASLHEIGHILALYICGGRTESLNLSFLGIGMVHHSELNLCDEVIFLLAGPAVNAVLLISGVAVDINGTLLVANILPIYPLDGGRALKHILNGVLGVDASDGIFLTISAMTIVILLVVALITTNISLAAIGIYSLLYIMFNNFD